MKNYTTIVDYKVWTNVYWNVFDNIENNVETIIRDNVRNNATGVIWVNIGDNVWHNSKLFQNNSIQQYKDNL